MLAVDQGADIINLSLGGSSSVAIDNAIQYAKSKDVVLVSAVGNDGLNDVAYPARHRDVIAVSSLMPIQGFLLLRTLVRRLICCSRCRCFYCLGE